MIYSFFCNQCSYKKEISNKNELESFDVLKSSSIQTSLPNLDSKKGSEVEQIPKLKCPKCGFPNRIKQKEENNGPT